MIKRICFQKAGKAKKKKSDNWEENTNSRNHVRDFSHFQRIVHREGTIDGGGQNTFLLFWTFFKDHNNKDFEN